MDVEVISAFDLADAARDKLAEVLGKKLERQVKGSHIHRQGSAGWSINQGR